MCTAEKLEGNPIAQVNKKSPSAHGSQNMLPEETPLIQCEPLIQYLRPPTPSISERTSPRLGLFCIGAPRFTQRNLRLEK